MQMMQLDSHSQVPTSSMSINSSSGVLTFNSAPDYETKSSYTATVTASDGTNSSTQDITVTITDGGECGTGIHFKCDIQC